MEAAAYGKPAISTRLGAEGLAFKEDEEILLEDDPVSFADACIELLTDKSDAHRLGSRQGKRQSAFMTAMSWWKTSVVHWKAIWPPTRATPPVTANCERLFPPDTRLPN